MREERGSWYLVTGVLLGIAIGLFFAWGISPVEYVNTSPISLRADFKDAYRAAIAAAYASTGDLLRAQARIELLQDDSPVEIMIEQGQRYLAEGYSYADAKALAELAAAFGFGSDHLTESSDGQIETEPLLLTPLSSSVMTATPDLAASIPVQTTPTSTVTLDEVSTSLPSSSSTAVQTPTITRTPIPVFTPLPTLAATATLAPPYVLENQELICDLDNADNPQIQVMVANALGEGVSGVEVIMQWVEREEHFFTGLKPEIDLGYADFDIIPQIIYTLHIADGGQVVSGLSAPECSDQFDQRYWGSWRLSFTHP